jgi:hypothetical protein
MRYSHALPALLIAVLLAGPVEARSAAQAADTSTQSKPDPAGIDALDTGSVALAPAEDRKKRFNDCMAIWDRATHMTKREWRRTCNSQLDDVPNL